MVGPRLNGEANHGVYKKPPPFSESFLYTPKRFRTAVAGMKIPSPGPLDDRGVLCRAKYS